MKHNLCVKISYKKYLLANTSFPPPVVLQYTSGRSEEPAARMRDCNSDEAFAAIQEILAVGRACSPNAGLQLVRANKGSRRVKRRKSLQPECGIATTMCTSMTPAPIGRKSLQPECGIATTWFL